MSADIGPEFWERELERAQREAEITERVWKAIPGYVAPFWIGIITILSGFNSVIFEDGEPAHILIGFAVGAPLVGIGYHSQRTITHRMADAQRARDRVRDVSERLESARYKEKYEE